MTRQRIVEQLSEKIGFNHREAKEIVDLFFECISEALARGEAVRLSGFGVFRLRDKGERPGRNPRTGEVIPVSARRVVTFHAGQKLSAGVGELKPGGSQALTETAMSAAVERTETWLD